MAESKQNESNVQFVVSKNVGLDAIQATQKLSEAAIKDHGCFRIAVSGGSFAKLFGNGLQQSMKAQSLNIEFAKWKVFFADERCVALDDDGSNYKGFKTEFMSKAKDIKSENVYPIDDAWVKNAQTEMKEKETQSEKVAVMDKMASQVCDAYLQDVMKEFNIDDANAADMPSFDAIFLGMGPDGHTASLFPGHSLLQSNKWVDFIVDSPKPPPHRITLSLPLICNAKDIIFVVTGKSKQDAFKQISDAYKKGKHEAQALPSGKVTQNAKGNVLWLLDEAAAASAKL